MVYLLLIISVFGSELPQKQLKDVACRVGCNRSGFQGGLYLEAKNMCVCFKVFTYKDMTGKRFEMKIDIPANELKIEPFNE